MTTYNKVTLTPELGGRLLAIEAKRNALRANIKMVTEQWERREAELLGEGQSTWSQIAIEYGLDVKRVNYALAEDTVTLVPTFVNLAP